MRVGVDAAADEGCVARGRGLGVRRDGHYLIAVVNATGVAHARQYLVDGGVARCGPEGYFITVETV